MVVASYDTINSVTSRGLPTFTSLLKTVNIYFTALCVKGWRWHALDNGGGGMPFLSSGGSDGGM